LIAIGIVGIVSLEEGKSIIVRIVYVTMIVLVAYLSTFTTLIIWMHPRV